MNEIKSSKICVEKSKFFGRLYNIENLDADIQNILDISKREFKNANHHCYAAVIGKEEIAKSGREVGHPGKVILETLKHSGLDHHCIIVSRVFGGIKLGPGGVSKAFRECAQLLVRN